MKLVKKFQVPPRVDMCQYRIWRWTESIQLFGRNARKPDTTPRYHLHSTISPAYIFKVFRPKRYNAAVSETDKQDKRTKNVAASNVKMAM